jgi:site-specific recombinase XerD
MDRRRVSAAAPGADDAHPAQGRTSARTRRPAGLAVIERDGHFHIHGTVTVRGRSKRLRDSTKLPARPEFKDAAFEIKRRIEAEDVEEVVFGKKPSLALGVAARQHLGLNAKGEEIPGEGRQVSGNDLKILKRVIKKFGLRQLDEISGAEWSSWIKAENRNNSAATIVRFATPIRVFLRWCGDPERGWLTVPRFDLPKLPRQRHRMRRRVAELTPALLVFFLEHAPIHLRAQAYTEWSTGARVSSILFGCRLCDLILAPGRNQITFHDTKNGDPITAHLHPAAADVVGEYLDHRGRLDEREGPLFLTDRHLPYSRTRKAGGYNGTNKTSWGNTVRRAVSAKRQQAAANEHPEEAARLVAEAELLAQVTQHWLRHWFATHALASGMDLRAIAEQGGWRDYRSIQGYQHDVPEVRRRAVEQLPIGNSAALGTSLTPTPVSNQK